MYSYIDLYFSPDGVSPLEIAERVRATAGVSSIVGARDLLFEWHSVEEFRDRLQRIHSALAGTGATYRIESLEESPEFLEPVIWPPAIVRAAEHPGCVPAVRSPGTPPPPRFQWNGAGHRPTDGDPTSLPGRGRWPPLPGGGGGPGRSVSSRSPRSRSRRWRCGPGRRPGRVERGP